MIIYCRHGDDENPDPSYTHDHHLVSSCREQCRIKASRLVKKYGYPSVIYCSPFLRARETLKAMWSSLEGGTPPRVIIDPALSRHFSSREQKNPSVSPSTKEVEIPIYESWGEFKDRCREHMKEMKEMGHYNSKEVVWCITHVLVLKRVASYFEIELPEYVPFLAHFSTSLARKEEKRGVKRRKIKEDSDKGGRKGRKREMDPYGSDSGLRDSKKWKDLKKHRKMMKLLA